MAEKASIALVTVCLLVAGVAYAPVPATAEPALEAAREELRLRVETERRMREEFESLLANGAMSGAEIADFESYLVRLATLVDEQRRIVSELVGADAAGASSGAAPLPGDFDRGRTDAEKIAMLDAELGSSLSEFDEKLLREQQEIADKSRATSTGESGKRDAGGSDGEGASDGEGGQAGGADGQSGENGGQSADAGGHQGAESGQGAGGEEQGDAAGKGAEQQGDAAGKSAEGAAGNEQVAVAGGAGSGGREENSPTTPADIPDGSDDDIVARQLREAAENEQDPELREKLWEEYRKYKKRTP